MQKRWSLLQTGEGEMLQGTAKTCCVRCWVKPNPPSPLTSGVSYHLSLGVRCCVSLDVLMITGGCECIRQVGRGLLCQIDFNWAVYIWNQCSPSSATIISIFSKQDAQHLYTYQTHNSMSVTLFAWCDLRTKTKQNRGEAESDKVWVFRGGGSEPCCPANQRKWPKSQRKGDFAGALRILLDCSDTLMHAHICMRTHFYAHTQMHIHA